MKQWPVDFRQFVLQDINITGEKPQLVKASLIERLSIRKMDPGKMHPNPEDEFSMESIGPNFEIVSNYAEYIRINRKLSKDLFDKPVVVEKMKHNGYMLLNGHHRWYAAMRMGLDKIRVKIVNPVHDEDIVRMLESTTNTCTAVFDLDEVLLATGNMKVAEIQESFLANKVPVRLKAGVPEVIRALQEKGFDIWVYTGEYYSEGEINLLFEVYDLKITGAMNAVRQKGKGYTQESKQRFNQKYKETLHIDNSSILITHTESKEFNHIEFGDKADWAGKILDYLKNTN